MIDTENGRLFLAFRIFFSSLDGRKEAKEDQGLTEAGEVWQGIRSALKKYQEKLPCPGRGLPLMEEKEAKEDQGLTEAGEVWPGTGAPPKRCRNVRSASTSFSAGQRSKRLLRS